MVRRTAVGLLACLLVASASSTHAQEPWPEPGEPAGTIDVLTAGVSVTLPRGWAVRGPEAFPPAEPSGPQALLWMDGFVAEDPEDDANCYLMREGRAGGALPLLVGGSLLSWFSPGQAEVASRVVSLPSGSATRVDLDDYVGPGETEPGDLTIYGWSRGLLTYYLACAARTAPLGRWLTIAESVRFDGGASVAPDGSDLRLRAPDAGLALAFPDTWMHWVPFDRLDSGTGRGILMAGRGPELGCGVWLWPFGEHDGVGRDDLEGFAEMLLETYRTETEDPTVVPVELPAGDGFRIDDQDPETGADRSAYLLAGSRGYVSLTCSGVGPRRTDGRPSQRPSRSCREQPKADARVRPRREVAGRG